MTKIARKPRARQARAELRRRQILQGALDCFTELGYAATTMGDICRRSGASTGSVYHQFPGKEELAAALYVEGVAQYQAGFVEALSAQRQARSGIQAVVRYHLGWVRDHSAWARYLFQMQRPEIRSSTETQLAELNHDFLGAVGAWVAPHVKRGAIRRAQPDVFASILLGPCQEYARHYLAGRAVTPLDDAARQLGRAAWQAMRADDGTRKKEIP
ncbi:MAG: TetR/AcrR family transcriptional regulator [bacterium]